MGATMDVAFQEAYLEACAALGDAIVQQRFLQRELERRDAVDNPSQYQSKDTVDARSE